MGKKDRERAKETGKVFRGGEYISKEEADKMPTRTQFSEIVRRRLIKVEKRNCPYCEDPLVINATHEYQIVFRNGQWVKEIGSVVYKCNNCREVLGVSEIEDILKAVDEL